MLAGTRFRVEPEALSLIHISFTIGKNARDAVKGAVMLEEVARCMHLSRQLGDPIRLPQDLSLIHI